MTEIEGADPGPSSFQLSGNGETPFYEREFVEKVAAAGMIDQDSKIVVVKSPEE